MISGQGYRR